MKKNGFLTFIAAIIPGCGQMYYGYMRRGVSLALWFWGILLVTVFTGLIPLAILLPIVWAYAFFDTFNIRALTYEQRLAFPDGFIPSDVRMYQSKVGGFPLKNTGRIAGWVLIVIGILILYNLLISRFSWSIYEFSPALGQILDSLPAIAVGVIVIIVGIRVLRGPSSADAAGDGTDDTVPFGGTPPQNPA